MLGNPGRCYPQTTAHLFYGSPLHRRLVCVIKAGGGELGADWTSSEMGCESLPRLDLQGSVLGQTSRWPEGHSVEVEGLTKSDERKRVLDAPLLGVA